MVAREGGGKPGKHGVLEAIEERVSRGRGGATLLDELWDKDCGVQVARRAGGEAGEVMGMETRVRVCQGEPSASGAQGGEPST